MEATTEEKKADPIKPLPIDVEEGELIPRNSTELSAIVKRVKFPERFKTFEDQFQAYMLARSLMGSKKWQLAINNIADIKGQLTIYGELPGALAEQTKEVKEKRVYVIDPNYTEISVDNKNFDAPLFAAVCEIQRKDRALKKYFYTMEEAKAAGQYPATKWDRDLKKKVPNEDSPWMKFTRIMLMRKALGLAIKMEFPDAMVGVPVAEYDYDVMPDAPGWRDVTEEDESSLADEINGADNVN